MLDPTLTSAPAASQRDASTTPNRQQRVLLAERQQAHAAREQALADSLRHHAEVMKIEAELLASGYFVGQLASW